MLIKRIRTKTRPSINIEWNWVDETNEIVIQMDTLEQALLDNGIIHAVFSTVSEDELTVTKELQFTSIENYVSYEKQHSELQYSNGDFINSVQYMINNGIAHTASYTFKP